MFGNHVETEEKWGWHWYDTYQMDTDAKVSNGVIKVENKWHKLQRIWE